MGHSMKKTLLAGPAVEPLTLAEAKAHLRLDGTDEDGPVERLIAAARASVESETRLVMIAQSWRVALDAWPRHRSVTLPVRPLLSVEAVRAFDAAGAATLVPAEDYEADREAASVTIKPDAAGLAPAVSAGGFAIDFTAGFGPEGGDVPAPLRQAMLMLLAHWFEQRSAVAFDAAQAVPAGAAALIAPYRRLALC
jgi:uncharacterized phiE125 gp8 family phage protein